MTCCSSPEEVIFRDLKPENVLLTGGVDVNGVAKLADFGLACPMRLEDGKTPHTKPNPLSIFDGSGFPTPDAGATHHNSYVRSSSMN